MLARAIAAFLLLPGTVAYVVPYLLARTPAWPWLGFAAMTCGTAVLLRCVRDFFVTGRGTLAPWSPPTRLVTTGLYGRSRNPMYIAVLMVLAGWCIAYPSSALIVYTVVVAVAFHLRILFYEEPRLHTLFGPEWDGYRGRVRRWI